MLHLYPGMGANARMFGPPWQTLEAAVCNDWPAWKGETSIADFATRLIEEHGIKEGDIAAGTSLGGILAGEIGKQVRLQDVILIGSAAKKEELHRLLALFRPLIPLAPMAFLKALSGSLPSKLVQMFAANDPEFIRAMCIAVFEWDGLAAGVPHFRIHGRKDRVIPLPPDIDHVINGGHLIAMTHAPECVAAIRNHLGITASSPQS